MIKIEAMVVEAEPTISGAVQHEINGGMESQTGHVAEDELPSGDDTDGEDIDISTSEDEESENNSEIGDPDWSTENPDYSEEYHPKRSNVSSIVCAH